MKDLTQPSRASERADSELRVVHVYKDVYPPVAGGIEKHIDTLRRAMPDLTSHVIVCARNGRTSVGHTRTGVEIRVAEFGRVLSVPLSPTFPLWLRSLDADIIHIHMPNPVGEAAALLTAGERPLVVSYHADIVRQARFMPLYRHLACAALDRAAAIVVGSRRMLETSPLLRGRSQETTVIPYAIDLERYRPDAVPATARQALRERYGNPLVIALGRLVYYKGLENLIRAMRPLDASVMIVGSGPLESRLRALTADLPNVHVVGEVSEEELPRYLAAADCFVLASTSRAESFGIATVEAQAMGVPAVVTDVGTGTVEAISPGETGLVVPPGDALALADAVRSLITDRERCASMGAAARERAQRLHAADVQAARFRKLYLRVLGR